MSRNKIELRVFGRQIAPFAVANVVGMSSHVLLQLDSTGAGMDLALRLSPDSARQLGAALIAQAEASAPEGGKA